jgi:hypothetical protein
MIRLPPDLPDRFLAANEVHARPYEPLDIPVRGSYLAIQVETQQREQERAHLRVRQRKALVHWRGRRHALAAL